MVKLRLSNATLQKKRSEIDKQLKEKDQGLQKLLENEVGLNGNMVQDKILKESFEFDIIYKNRKYPI